MLSTDREEFVTLLRTLCAGFNVPATPEREDAYWRGLSKMSLLQFARVIDYALSEQGPDKLPIPKSLWRLHRDAKTEVTQVTHSAKVTEHQDHLAYYANRMLLRHVMSRNGVGSVELSAARMAVADVVQWFCGPIREGDADATPHAFITAYVKALQRVSAIDASTLSVWNGMLKEPRAQEPFPPFMGRELHEQRQMVAA
jgi:hypothetical protein